MIRTILAALDAAGGAEYLLRQTDENPVAFMTLLGKLLPTQLTGKDGGAILNAFDHGTIENSSVPCAARWLIARIRPSLTPTIGVAARFSAGSCARVAKTAFEAAVWPPRVRRRIGLKFAPNR